MVFWNMQIKILYILSHTDNDKDWLQYLGHHLHNFREAYLGNLRNKQYNGKNTKSELCFTRQLF